MGLEDFALIAEIIGGIAVILSLLFVGFEVRKSTKIIQASTFQESVGYDIELLLGSADSQENARVYFAYRDHPESLSDDEQRQGALIWGAAARHAENLFMQFKNGMLDRKSWEAREPLVKAIINTAGFKHSQREFWGGYLDGPFADYVRQNQSND